MKPVSVGICGLGTVGGGVFNILSRNAGEIGRRAGRDISVAAVAIRNPKPEFDLTGVEVFSDIFELAKSPDIDVFVETIGGEQPALDLVLTAINHGKHVVTANKALIALHGNEIFSAAQEKGVMVAFEAAVAGGIPIIKGIREGLTANRIQWLAGIINGTGNFILTEMKDKGRAFDDVLAEAQALGYAEADPTFDVEGIDAAHKLTILASIAFGIPLQFDKVFTEGISTITKQDVAYAEELGYRIKHLGIARQVDEGIELRVHPTLIPEEKLLANVHGVMNAVMVQADAVGPTLYYGAGAGAEPTGSAVVADVIDVARVMTSDPDNRVPHLAFHADSLESTPVLPIEETQSGFYLRLQVADETGVMADIAQILSREDINIEAIIQKEAHPDNQVPLILLIREVKESSVDQALAAISALPANLAPPVKIRVEHLD